MEKDAINTVLNYFIKIGRDMTKETEQDFAMGLIAGLQLSVIHPEYAASLGKRLKEQCEEMNAPLTWLKRMPELAPIEGVI